MNEKTATVELFAPEGYWTLTPAQKKDLCNGCGPKKLAGWIIPDTIWGLCITAACDIHDYMYRTGNFYADKTEADRVFLNNMIRLIDARTRYRWLKLLRLLRAYTYYRAVDLFGGPFFWFGKNDSVELGAV